MLRTTFLNQLNDNLGRGSFRPEEFIIENTELNETIELLIAYRFDNEFFLKSYIPESGVEIEIECCPGNITQKESISVKGSYSFFEEVYKWTRRLREELMARPTNRLIVEQQKEIEDLLQRFTELPDEYFTKEEASEMKERLDDLEKSLIEKLQTVTNDQKLLEKKENELRLEIEELKMTIEVLKKPGWAGSLMVKISNLFKDQENKKLLKEGAIEVGKQLLIEAGKKQIGA